MKQNPPPTDEQLVKQFARGADEAFDRLLERYKSKLYAYILYYVKNADVADDLFQETFVKAIVTIKQGRYVENGRFGAWLLRIAHNLVVDQFRAERTEGVVSLSAAEASAWGSAPGAEQACRSAAPTDGGIEMRLVAEQDLRDVRQLVAYLPEAQRRVVYLRYYRDLSFKEIAAATGVSINTALGRMRYALLNMRKMAAEHHLFSH